MIHKVVEIIRMHIIVAGLTALMLCSSVVVGTSVAKAAGTSDAESQIAELTAKLATLQSMLVKLLAGGGMAATTSPTGGEMKGPVIPVGTQITLMSGIQVRSDAGGRDTLLGIQATGTVGTIIAGPVKANDHIWYQVDFETGIDGWCLAGGLLKKTNAKDLLPSPERQATSSEKARLKAEIGIPAKLDYLRAKLASTTDPVVLQKMNDAISKLLERQASNSLLWKPKASNTLDSVRKPRATTTPEFRLRPRATSTLERRTPLVPQATTSGSVLGATTDVYSEISATLQNISVLLNETSTNK